MWKEINRPAAKGMFISGFDTQQRQSVTSRSACSLILVENKRIAEDKYLKNVILLL
jgi:hypothetical protein